MLAKGLGKKVTTDSHFIMMLMISWIVSAVRTPFGPRLDPDRTSLVPRSDPGAPLSHGSYPVRTPIGPHSNPNRT